MRIGNTEIRLVTGDLTEAEVDAIVNAANPDLLPGGGVCGAIHRVAGPTLAAECEEIRAAQGPVETGAAVATGAGDLPARFVIHTVGPIWRGGGSHEPEQLVSCYRKSLALAAEKGARSIAFPSVSTGIFGYPVEQAAPVAIGTAAAFARENDSLAEIRFVLFSEEDRAAYEWALEALGGEE